MATPEERTALLAVTCPHCLAIPGEVCTAAVSGRRADTEGGRRRPPHRPITTLDGGCHDARWMAALGRPARVLSAVVDELRPPRALTSAGAERPW